MEPQPGLTVYTRGDERGGCGGPVASIVLPQRVHHLAEQVTERARFGTRRVGHRARQTAVRAALRELLRPRVSRSTTFWALGSMRSSCAARPAMSQLRRVIAVRDHDPAAEDRPAAEDFGRLVRFLVRIAGLGGLKADMEGFTSDCSPTRARRSSDLSESRGPRRLIGLRRASEAARS